VAEHPGDAVGNRQTEPESALGLAGLGGQTLKLHKDIAEVLFRDAGSSVPNLDAQVWTAASATDKDAAAFSVAQRIRQKVLNDPAQQRGVAADSCRRVHQPQFNAAFTRYCRKFLGESRQ
jgi:hypothetical protein